MTARTLFQIRLEDRDDTHNVRSAAMILQAAALAQPRAVAVLGCGKCVDIPIQQLTTISDRLDLVDADVSALKFVESQFPNDSHCSRALHHADLTGLVSQIQPTAQDLVLHSSDPLQCIDGLAEWLAASKPRFWRPPRSGRYELLICSAVLTQLQATVREKLQQVFLNRFPLHRNLLLSHGNWKDSVLKFARKLEDAFIDHLDLLIYPGGLIYLSDTVHVCWLTQSDSRTFTTEGAWLATRTSRLADYLGSRQIIGEGQWKWIRRSREGRFWGRLYGVQAVIYQPPHSTYRHYVHLHRK